MDMMGKRLNIPIVLHVLLFNGFSMIEVKRSLFLLEVFIWLLNLKLDDDLELKAGVAERRMSLKQ
jgi:hypothetical protein